MSLTQAIAQRLKQITMLALLDLCPDWFSIIINNGKIDDIIIKTRPQTTICKAHK